MLYHLSCASVDQSAQSQTQLLRWTNPLFLIIISYGRWFPRLVYEFEIRFSTEVTTILIRQDHISYTIFDYSSIIAAFPGHFLLPIPRLIHLR